MLSDLRASRPGTGPGDAPVPVVVVEDWRDTFGLPPELEQSFDAGSVWVDPASVVVGLALIAVTWATGSAGAWQLVLASPVFFAAWVVLALARGSARTDARAYGVATAAWMWGASSFSASGLRLPIVAAIIAVGAAGQLVAARNLRRIAKRRRDAIRSLADGRARVDGWIVAVGHQPLRREVTVGAADGSGRTWSAEHRAWRGPRPAVGHPVGIWCKAAGGAAVVLAPRLRPA